ncbi:hypothetical protein E2C01_045676 [Portunus trituberculatus]|uniref:Uncharacterized protein n=1 Tax=Portunus trituberculatus TaxID=210409 RepID=A0A5B7FYX5_PORTR|nr:hypothetical protein [Portunus trituberculatus]
MSHRCYGQKNRVSGDLGIVTRGIAGMCPKVLHPVDRTVLVTDGLRSPYGTNHIFVTCGVDWLGCVRRNELLYPWMAQQASTQPDEGLSVSGSQSGEAQGS